MIRKNNIALINPENMKKMGCDVLGAVICVEGTVKHGQFFLLFPVCRSRYVPYESYFEEQAKGTYQILIL